MEIYLNPLVTEETSVSPMTKMSKIFSFVSFPSLMKRPSKGIWQKFSCRNLITMVINQRLSRACIVHLVIKKTNWSYVKTMSCSGSHLEITINIKNTKFVKDLPMIDAQFRFNQCNSFREEYISAFSPYGPVLILWPVVAAILDFRSA